jgi:hypothetical protein
MSRFDIPEARSMLYVTSLSGSYRANFACVHYILLGRENSLTLIQYLRRILGHSRYEWVREKHDSKACCSNLRPHGGEHTHRWSRYQDVEAG